MRTVIFLLFIICAENIFSQCPSAGVDFTVCGNIAQLNSDGVTGYWSGPPYAVFSPSANDPDASVGIPAFPESQRTEVFTWNETGCTPPESVTVTFLKPPLAEGNTPQSVCGMATQLSADTIGSGATSAYWTSYIPGVYINYTGPDPLPWNPVVDVSLVAPGYWVNDQLDVWFYWVVTNSAGCTGEDSVKVIFYRIPEAYAGSDTAVCGTSFTLQASWSISNHTGFWSLMPPNPGSANFSPNNDPNALATVAPGGEYYFIWTEINASNTICSDKDTVQVYFMHVPSPTVGPDFSVCGKFAHIQAYTSYPYGQWSCLQGGVAYYDGINGNYNSAYQDSASSYIRYPSENVTITMCWTEFNGICYGYDCVDITFLGTSPAIELVGAGDTIVCGPVFTLLNAQPPSFGSGYWIDTIFGTVFTPSATNPGPTTAIIDTSNGGSYGYHSFYWITTNQMCRDTSDEVKVLFIKHPEANAGGNYWPGLFGQNSHIKTDTVCGLSYQMGAIPSAGQGVWYSTDPQYVYFLQGNGTTSPVYNDSLLINCYGCYTVFNQVGDKYRAFIWQENNQGCIDTDTLRLYFAPNPTGQFFATTPWCRHYESMIIANTWPAPNNVDYGITSFQWTYPNGVLSPQIPNPTVSETIYVSWPAGETHNVTLITSNQWGCSSGLVSHTVIEPQPFSVSSLQEPASCLQDNGSVTLSTLYGQIPQYYTFHWFPDSLYPNPFSVTQDGLSPFSYHTVQVTGESYSVDAPPGTDCYDTLTFFVRDTGAITAQFDTISLQQNHSVPYQVQLINQTLYGMYYLWEIYNDEDSLVFTSITEHPIYLFTEESCYEIILIATSKFDCRDTTTYTLCLESDAVQENPENELIKITPNPCYGDFTVVNSKTFPANTVLNVYDILGNKIENIDFTRNRHSNRITVNTGSWLHGVYMIEILYKGVRFNSKIIKLK